MHIVNRPLLFSEINKVTSKQNNPIAVRSQYPKNSTFKYQTEL
jgi:hypothetical protein